MWPICHANSAKFATVQVELGRHDKVQQIVAVDLMGRPVAVCYFPHRLQRTLSAGVVMDKGLEHDVDEVEGESKHDVDHV